MKSNKNPATLERERREIIISLHLFKPTNTKHCNEKNKQTKTTKATFECAHKKKSNNKPDEKRSGGPAITSR